MFEQNAFMIALEGIDQSGKQTQTTMLTDALESKGHTVRTLSFPDYQTPIGQEIRDALQGRREYPPETMQLLHAANRYEHRDKIQDWLE